MKFAFLQLASNFSKIYQREKLRTRKKQNFSFYRSWKTQKLVSKTQKRLEFRNLFLTLSISLVILNWRYTFWDSAELNEKFTFLRLVFQVFQKFSTSRIEDTQETQLFFLQILKNSKSRFKNAKTIGILQMRFFATPFKIQYS